MRSPGRHGHPAGTLGRASSSPRCSAAHPDPRTRATETLTLCQQRSPGTGVAAVRISGGGEGGPGAELLRGRSYPGEELHGAELPRGGATQGQGCAEQGRPRVGRGDAEGRGHAEGRGLGLAQAARRGVARAWRACDVARPLLSSVHHFAVPLLSLHPWFAASLFWVSICESCHTL